MLFDYTSSQKQAVETIDRNLQIMAGAGSGKTRVVAGRVVHILRERSPDITPENIVVLTFARKAAAEVRDRIGRFHEQEFGHRQGLAGLFVGTFHVFCLELLQTYLPGWLQVEILDEVRQRLFNDKYSRQSGMAELEMRRYADSGRYAALLRIMRESKLDRNALKDHPALRALESYRALLARHKFVDYDEIIYRAVQELRQNEAMREAVAERVRYVIVDEYQDCSPIQERLLRLLHDLGANVAVVGDHNQTVYQWRGSDPALITGFASRYPDVAQVALTTNYRSSPAVIALASRIIERNPDGAVTKMSSAQRQTFERGDLLCLQFATPAAEAEWIADKIEQMRGLPF